MKAERIEKAQSISKKILSEYIILHLKELLLEYGIVTITQVKISNDLSYLDVYVSSLKSHDTLTKALGEKAPEMHRLLGKKIDFIKVPRIRFRYDESGEHSFNIHRTIQNLDTK